MTLEISTVWFYFVYISITVFFVCSIHRNFPTFIELYRRFARLKSYAFVWIHTNKTKRKQADEEVWEI